MSKTCDRCGKELTDRDRTTICLECEVALAEEENERLETENAALWEKIAALVKAESEGRLHIAPYKEGDTMTAPEVHGQWVHMPDKSDVYYDTYQCSNCNEEIVVDLGLEKPKFCPNCGARMDGGEGE
ncbi:hypothetical protein [Christensenella tenuis]|jgi:predicted amidophosphoribosyltransferase|uniref:Uncharacterized protein n=1 Tax=Christensenella tenuis TaxID=2763033 RepID=A0ABR7EFD4_9FIRM|nr:hypothetical protein [Christensenella tenuis]MBC5648485.1 hypothetical protein [Christensenella tenuis]